MTTPDRPDDGPPAEPAFGGEPRDIGRPVDEGPVGSGERLVSLDFIRGVAVLGILVANITAFAHVSLAYSWPPGLPGGGNATDRAIWLAQLVLVDGKFRGLFTLLFGAGLAMFVERARMHGGSAAAQIRRLVLLGLFGLAHFYLLFTGDILFLYAVAGLVALAFVDWSARGQLWFGLVWYLVLGALQALLLAYPAMLEASPDLRASAGEAWSQALAAWQAREAAAAAEHAVMSGGDLGAIIAFRFAEESYLLPAYVYLAFIDTIPVMLLGMALYRRGFFVGALPHRRMRAGGWVGLVAGGLASLTLGLWVMRAGFPPLLTSFVANGAAALVRLPMVLGMAALLVLWAPRAAEGWLGARIVAAGRMAFSNYIGTSLVMALIFQGWAGGLYGQLDRAELLLAVAGGCAAMLGWSQPWLARYRHGPLEWLWRCLTYGRLFPFRREKRLAIASNSH